MRGKVFAVLLVLAGAISFSSGAQAAELQPVTIGIGGKTLLSYLPVTLADRLGYFRDAGVNVQLDDFRGGSKALEALVGGSVDINAGAYENTIFMQAKGIDLEAVALMQNRFGFVFGLSKAVAAKYHSPKDLKGLKIGVTAPGSAQGNALDIILGKGGLKPTDISMIGVGGGPGAIAAMESGQIDGILSSDPVITRLQLDHAIVPIVDSREDEGQKYLYGGPCASAAIYTTTAFAKAHPERVQAVVDGVVRAIKWMHGASIDQIVAAVPPAYYGADKAAYEKSLAANMGTFSKDGTLAMAEAANTYRAMVSSGRLTGNQKIDLAKTFDDRFAAAANKKE